MRKSLDLNGDAQCSVIFDPQSAEQVLMNGGGKPDTAWYFSAREEMKFPLV